MEVSGGISISFKDLAVFKDEVDVKSFCVEHLAPHISSELFKVITIQKSGQNGVLPKPFDLEITNRGFEISVGVKF